jgi:hypothetical protein
MCFKICTFLYVWYIYYAVSKLLPFAMQWHCYETKHTSEIKINNNPQKGGKNVDLYRVMAGI